MSARQAGSFFDRLQARVALVAVVTLATVVGLAGCASQQRAEKKRGDASTFNTALGISYLQQGNIPLAKEKLDRALQENPDNPEVHSARAMLFDRMHEPKNADQEYKTALRLAPNDPNVSNNYAVYLCQAARTTEGVRRFQDVAHNALYVTPWVAYTNAGVCLRSAKHNAEAIKDFKQALQIQPNFAEAAFQLGDLQLNDGNLVDARTTVDAFIGAFNPTADLLLLGVRIARAQSDRPAAERFARRLRLDFPSSAQTRALADLDHNPG